MVFEDLLKEIKSYGLEEEEIKKAYEMAKLYHEGQYRQSGEPYITHPLNVAFILAKLHADKDTICAGLLHDLLEDTKCTKEEIARCFNPEVANMVDGVTKLAKMNFSSKEDQYLANTRKIISSIKEDVRIIIIKLADRLHNMRTLQFKSELKQKENAKETLSLFAKIADYIGAYHLKIELEDLSLKYLEPEWYKKIQEQRYNVQEKNQECIKEMIYKIKTMLDDKEIPNELKYRIKSVYGIYKHLIRGHKLSDVHDLIALSLIVDEVEKCYYSLYLVHKEYHPFNEHFKDYICSPKTNMYSALHTTVFGLDGRLIQVQIKTLEMDQISSYGLTAYWNIKKGNVREIMQENLKNSFQFYKPLQEIDKMAKNNKQFVRQMEKELLGEQIYIYTSNGNVIGLPLGSTPIDLAYRLNKKTGNNLKKVLVNDEEVPLDYHLESKDRVKIITEDTEGPKKDWIEKVQTSYAKRKIKEYTEK